LTVAMMVTGSCESQEPVTGETTPRTEHEDGEGPLSASSGSGGSAIFAPGVSPWYGSFGSFILCSTSPGTDLVLQDGRFDTPIAPVAVAATIRKVTPKDLRHAGDEIDSYLPFATALGSPPGFDEPYVDSVPAGEFINQLAGTSIDQKCADAGDEAQGFKELIVTVEVNGDGGEVSDFYVDYEADERPMTLHVDWTLSSCGNEISDPEACA
jgi:hypothetical protein